VVKKGGRSDLTTNTVKCKIEQNYPSLVPLSFSSLSAALEAWTAEPRTTATRKHATPGKRISALLIRLSRK
jgi:hypothetical protein